MPVVVSDTSPLHYLVLIRHDSILKTLYGEITVPPAVLAELTHPAAPGDVVLWAKSPPPWLKIKAPQRVPPQFDDLDIGERQALTLAQEFQAELVLLDDKAARKRAQQQGLKVKGTIGVLAEAARRGLLSFRETVEELRQTSMHFTRSTAQRFIDEFEKETGKRESDV